MKIRHFLSLLLVATLMLGIGAPAFAVGEGPRATTLDIGDDIHIVDFTITSPYKDLDWDANEQFKGNFHTHSKASDGSLSLADMIEQYYTKGYDILAMTDHSTLSLDWDKQPTGPKGRINITLAELAELFLIDFSDVIAAGITDPPETLITTMGQLNSYYIKMGQAPFDYPDNTLLTDNLFSGRTTTPLTTDRYNEILTGVGREGRVMTQVAYSNEQNFIRGDHVNTYYTNVIASGMGSLESAIELAHNNGGLSLINHPGRYTGSPEEPDQATVNKYANLLLQYDSCIGIEILNKSDSHANDRVLWDRVLMETAPLGRNVYALGNDDAHKATDVGRNWNMMLMPSNTNVNVRTALENGTSYVSGRRAKAEGVNVAIDSLEPTPVMTKIDIDETADTITITGTNYTSIEWVADGEIIATEDYNAAGNTLDLREHGSEIGSYVRAQLKGTGGISFTQPFLLTKSELSLIVPDNWELEVGDSRTVDYVFPEEVEERVLTWTSSDPAVATVDKWGRVTAVSVGTAKITATQDAATGMADTVTLNVVSSSTTGAPHAGVVNYQGTAVAEVENLQKIVTRWTTAEAQASSDVPVEVKDAIDAVDKTPYAAATTADGAAWEITAYGVLRTGGIAATSRDQEMRFMGDRYFHHATNATGTNAPVVLAVLPDGENGIWTITVSGVTHIEMVKMTAREKAIEMSDTTQENVSRRGMVSQASLINGDWVPRQTDNDGLWTAMYGAGELFRYAQLKKELASNPSNAELQQQVADALAVATRSVEAVLLLSNISMREETAEAYVRYNQEGNNESREYDGTSGKLNDRGQGLSWTALEKDGDYSRKVPDFSPWDNSQIVDMSKIVASGDVRDGFVGNPLWLAPFHPTVWSNPRDPANSGKTYETQTRLLEGFWARTYFIEDSDYAPGDDFDQGVDGRIYWRVNNDDTATGDNVKGETVNGEYLKGVTVSASGEIPERLYRLMGSPELDKIVYKGDTSMDEVIGHLFIYKIAYDILGPEDSDLAGIIADTMEKFAQHLSDNSWMLVDATGQPTTWGKINREYFYSYRWGNPAGPMNCSVLLCAFKLAAYVTGNQKWEDEYQLAAKVRPYEYSTLMGKYEQRGEEFLNMFAAPMLHEAGFTSVMLGDKTMMGHLKAMKLDAEISFLTRMFAQYSDEEMAALAFYLLFQLETDPGLLADYRDAFDFWWESSYQYSENPLWYYIYQLAYPSKTITDAYGNNILETAAWSLSRHPVDTRLWNASNQTRDDIINFDMETYQNGPDTRGGLSIVKTDLPPKALDSGIIVGIVLLGGITTGGYNLSKIDPRLPDANVPLSIEYAVAAPDERAMHKYNNSSYKLDDENNPNQMEGSTTYTLPYWMGVYHGMLKPLPASQFVNPGPVNPKPDEKEPTPAYKLFIDVNQGDWFHDAVTFVANEELFQGVGNNKFAPGDTMTRGMMATVLYRIAGEPAVSGGVAFNDVVSGEWYYDAIVWASSNGIVTGYNDTVFGVGDNVTREQIATMFYRYAKFAKFNIGKTTNLNGFTDAGSVSDFALDAMKWAVASEIITGRGNGTLAPGSSATRAEVATMCMRFFDNVISKA